MLAYENENQRREINSQDSHEGVNKLPGRKNQLSIYIYSTGIVSQEGFCFHLAWDLL